MEESILPKVLHTGIELVRSSYASSIIFLHLIVNFNNSYDILRVIYLYNSPHLLSKY